MSRESRKAETAALLARIEGVVSGHDQQHSDEPVVIDPTYVDPAVFRYIDDDGQDQIRINPDGSVWLADGWAVDDAARLFWDAVEGYAMELRSPLPGGPV